MAMRLVHAEDEVWGEREEIVDTVPQVEVRDKRSHEPRFADAGCQGKAKGWEFTLEIRDRREFGSNRIERRLKVRALPRWNNFRQGPESPASAVAADASSSDRRWR